MKITGKTRYYLLGALQIEHDTEYALHYTKSGGKFGRDNLRGRDLAWIAKRRLAQGCTEFYVKQFDADPVYSIDAAVLRQFVNLCTV